MSSLNNRVSGTEDETAKLVGGLTDSLERAKDSSKEEAKKLILPKRNLFVQFKAFPNLEQLKTGTVWQRDEESEFNYRS